MNCCDCCQFHIGITASRGCNGEISIINCMKLC